MFIPDQPYNELPGLPPSQSLDSLELYKALVFASESLATLSATAEHLPNQAALYQSVILLEAKASSEIEQIVTTDNKLFGSKPRAKSLDPLTKEVLRYGEAVHHGWEVDRPLCTPVIEEICSIIRDKDMQVRRIPGTALKRLSTGEVIYTPPAGETLIRDLLDNLFHWINDENSIHPIIKAAILHQQFESIHPFSDGNGRTGRIMVVLYLVEQGLLKAPVLFLSGEILRERDQYYSHLQYTRRTGDWIPYLLWFINLVTTASVQSTIRAKNVRKAMQILKSELRALDSSIYSQDLVNALFRSPIIFAQDLMDMDIVGSITTAHTYLKKLETAGLIFRSKIRYDRKVGYINDRLFEALSGEIDLT